MQRGVEKWRHCGEHGSRSPKLAGQVDMVFEKAQGKLAIIGSGEEFKNMCNGNKEGVNEENPYRKEMGGGLKIEK